MNYPHNVTIVEVGPRDGLQNEPTFVPSINKINLINQLSRSGLQRIEVTSFVSSKAIPQLIDSELIYMTIDKLPNVRYSALIPNIYGMYKALDAGVNDIAIFTAASETFNQRNINCSIAESFARFKPVIHLAKERNILVRGYISCALGCPYEGAIKANNVTRWMQQLLDLGVDEVCLGDTIGVGTPNQTNNLIEHALKILSIDKLAMHFHDTYGQAIANIYAALQCGVHLFDSAIAGLGGCPYAKGASGNVATEDVLYLMHGLGISTGVDIYQIVRIGNKLCTELGLINQSKVSKALTWADNK
ncbi:MAG: hydroxymethylglutaryl-CoA lyase [Legionellales bacterium RIFCSPHIGHO2_12_FULL_42_9]|nr:MAG: hydroxymethylglutaryl-CoA lyase [Legionellales bacterium RIFCSPHIGHO2_12_FULL_42_9]